MASKIVVTCVNDGKKYPNIKVGTSLVELVETIKPDLKYPVIAALVNNQLQSLNYEIFKSKHIKFIDITSTIGMGVYIRSLTFILIKAFNDIFPEARLKVGHSISKGIYFEMEGLNREISTQEVETVKKRMHEIVKADIPFERREVHNEEAIKIYEDDKQFDKVKLFKDRKIMYTSLYYLENTLSYFYEYIAASTKYIDKFDVLKYNEGLLMRFPNRKNPEILEELLTETKMFEVFKEYKHWAKVLGVENVGSLNELIRSKNIGNLVKISEALHEKKIASIADAIYAKKDKVQLVLLAGPSSSGKTSTCKRLSIQLQVLGLKTMLISLDNYFVSRELTPLDADGEFDFECLEAIDIKQFNEDILGLMAGEAVEIPKFDFASGLRTYTGNKAKVEKGTIFIVEGIHGLTPGLTPQIPNEVKFKIYVSALTQISIDSHNRVPTSDNRLIRRMVRDFKYRAYSGLNTIKRWPSVRRGEELNIFPFQENADAIFNSALLYEIAVLKQQAVPILSQIPQTAEEFAEAKRLLKFLSYFNDVPQDIEKEIPPTSILREFLGGSSFKY